MSRTVNVGFIGNPNCGKTTLFNAYTGANLKVANWPGVTVEKKEGHTSYEGQDYKLIDLPGIYSLSSYTMEEKVSRECILSDEVDVIVDIADASSLERNLYLTLQLIELGKPVVLALNMMDIVEERGMEIDLLMERISNAYPDFTNKRWLAIKYLEQDESAIELWPLDTSDILDRVYEKEIINQKYDFIEEIISEILVNKSSKEERTDHIDRFLTGRYTGLPIFLAIMALVFFLTFFVGDFLKGYFEIALDALSSLVSNGMAAIHTGEMVTSLVVDGIIAGVGSILTFLPNIFILFLALAFLEDSGYMARVAFVMDDIMSRLGLSGRAFIPLLLGFGMANAYALMVFCLLYVPCTATIATIHRETGSKRTTALFVLFQLTAACGEPCQSAQAEYLHSVFTVSSLAAPVYF